MRRDADRLEASLLLADSGWGKAAGFEPQEGDPLDLAALEGAAEQFRASIADEGRKALLPGPFRVGAAGIEPATSRV